MCNLQGHGKTSDDDLQNSRKFVERGTAVAEDGVAQKLTVTTKTKDQLYGKPGAARWSQRPGICERGCGGLGIDVSCLLPLHCFGQARSSASVEGDTEEWKRSNRRKTAPSRFSHPRATWAATPKVLYFSSCPRPDDVLGGSVVP